MQELPETVQNHAEFTFAEFSKRSGSQEIARVDALKVIGDIVIGKGVKSVLEIGSGIGTITCFLQNTKLFGELKIVGFEKDEWCRNQLRNVAAELLVLSDSKELRSFSAEVDLLIIDDFLDYELTQTLISNTRPRLIFIEGHRRIQRLYVWKSLKSTDTLSNFKNFSRTQDSYKVGCVFDCTSKNNNVTYARLFILTTLFFSKISEIRSRIEIRNFFSTFFKT